MFAVRRRPAQSINPLLTTHPLAHQVQRYVLLTTLVQYDSALHVTPYFARRWDWSRDSLALTLHLSQDLRWQDGVPTTARDVVWTLDAARDPATGYSRQDDLTDVEHVTASDDSTVTLTFRRKQNGIPDLLTDLAILPAHLLDSVPHARLRGAAWNQSLDRQRTVPLRVTHAESTLGVRREPRLPRIARRTAALRPLRDRRRG